MQAEPLQREVQAAAGQAEGPQNLPVAPLRVFTLDLRLKGERQKNRQDDEQSADGGDPGAISSRTARATIQFPDQRSSVPSNTSQAVKRIERAIIACVLDSTDAHCARGGSRDRV